jgi:C4-dicarboxylate-binding protein DctP
MNCLARVLVPALLLGAGVAAQAEYLIQFSHVDGSQSVKGRAADFFAGQVNERLAGKVKVEVFSEAKLYDDAAVIAALSEATAETGIMAAPDLSGFIRIAGGLGVFEVPFLFDRIEDVHRLVDSPIRDKLLLPLEEIGIKGLAIWDEGMRVFSVRGFRPLRKPPDDFRGKRFRSSGSEVDKAMIEALGGIAHELPAADVFSALSEGTLDGQDSVWSRTHAAKLYEVQDWISVSDHLFQGFLVVVGSEFWNALPEEIRAELSGIIDQSTAKAREYAAAAVAEDRKRIEESGTATVLGLTSDERENWRNAVAGVEQRLAPRIGEDLIAQVREMLAQPDLSLPEPPPEDTDQAGPAARVPSVPGAEPIGSAASSGEPNSIPNAGQAHNAGKSADRGRPGEPGSARETGPGASFEVENE